MKLYKLTATQVIEAYKSGEFKPSEYIQEIYERILEVEGEINSFITIRSIDELLREAEIADKMLKQERKRKLLGLPVAVKDVISTKGIRTTCGSKILKDYIPVYDATVVKLIREEGGIILGKTNMDEFAMGSTTENSAFGPTRNPWDTTRVPGGSSGGSATALASGQAPLALGSDTGGSIRCPASFTFTYGLKPTYGLISRYGLIAYANSLEQVGPMARDSLDLALLLTVISKYDSKDSTCIPGPRPDYYYELSKWEPDLEGLKLGLIRESIGEGIEKPVLSTFKKAVSTLESLGVEVEEVSLPHIKWALPAYYVIAMSEASSNLARYDGVRYGYKSRRGRDWNESYMATRGEGFGVEVKRRIMLGSFILSAGYFEMYYVKALKLRRLIKQDIDHALKRRMGLIAPTMPVLPFKIGEKIEDPLSMYMVDILTVPANLAGVPSISIPAGFSQELPVGLQVIGPPLSELLLLKIARAYEVKAKTYNKIAEVS